MTNPPDLALGGATLKALADALGVRVTSWKRTPEENAKIGGKPDSYHLQGAAIDVGLPLEDWKRRALAAISREVDETKTGGTGPHYHYQVDGKTRAFMDAIHANLAELESEPA